MSSVYGERIARLEERVGELEKTMARVETKLDSLLDLKNKGAGAFWLVSIIFGSGVVVSIVEVIRWFSGK